MRVLIVEDDAEIADFVARGLEQSGHVADRLTDGRDGLSAALDTSYDAAVVDRMLPGLDGLSMVRALRAAGNATPVLFLTSISGVDDRVEGLEAGGDDYLTKPFAFSELLARLHALARRPPRQEAELARLTYRDLEVDVLKRKVSRGGRAIDLNTKEFLVLEALMRAEGRVLTRTMLLEKVWDIHFDPQTSVVETHVSRLRAKIEKPFDGPPLIRTVRGIGYALAT